MKTNYIPLLITLLLAPLAALAIAPTALKTEFLENPLGIDTANPRFLWIVEDPIPGAKQTAYQLQAASSAEKLAKGEADLWDSGKVASDETLGIEYGGPALPSRSFVWWRIKVWDGNAKESDWSKPAMFSVGLRQPQDWQAQWIGAPPDNSVKPHFGFRSKEAAAENEIKWVQVDLGSVQNIDGFKLWGTWPVEVFSPSGDGFPLRFKIEVAQKGDFSDAKIVVDRTARDFTGDLTEIGSGAVSLTCPPVAARYVRLTATKLSGSYEMVGAISPGKWDDSVERWRAVPTPKKNKNTSWKLALAEMEVMNGGNNIARGAKVTASDSYEDAIPSSATAYNREGWKREHLTDGRTEGTPGSLFSRQQPTPLLRKEFTISKPVKRATLYATALGNYEARLNGKKVGDQKLAPGWVNYSARVLYQTHDVTGLLRPGSNAVAAMLADGWYRLRNRADFFGSAERVTPGSGRPALFRSQLEIEYEDGSREVVATDGSWQCHTDGPMRYASMYDGVTYDARKEIPGWDEPGKMGDDWKSVMVRPNDKIELTAQTHEPVRVLQTIAPVKVSEPKKGVKIYDFGTSMAGFCRLTLDGPAGAEVKLRYAEVLKPDGTLYVGSLHGLFDNGDRYQLDGKGARTFEPDFTYHGFRYVEVTGGTSAIRDITACDLSTDTRKTGFFESSDPRLNKLCDIIERAYRANTPSTTVDNAGRDERLTWMGDCFGDEVQSLAYLFGSAGLFANTVQIVSDGTSEDGLPGYLAIQGNKRERADAGWSDSGIAGAWGSWVNFGDRRTLEQGYAAATRYMDAVAAKAKDGLPGDNYKAHFGDWLSSRQTIKPGAKTWDEIGGIGAPNDLFAAAMWAECLDSTAKMAKALGKNDEARRYADLLAALQAAIVKKFVRPDGTVEGGTPDHYALFTKPQPKPAGGDEQSSYALALAWLPDDLRAQADNRLLEAIQKLQGHLGTGSYTTIYLLRYMADHGMQDLAYEMVMKPTCPSYGFMVDNGATATWERFDGYHPQLGFNPHQMNGLIFIGLNSVYEWIFSSLAGIRPDPAHPGYKHFFISPKPPKGLDWVKARYDSVRGPITVEWKKAANGLNLVTSVPPNTSATITLPNGDTKHVESGQHEFTIPQKKQP
jgi:alpha-L-rhamnosidase